MSFKNTVLHILFGLKIFRHGVSFGKGSYIREHSVIRRHGGLISLGKNTGIMPYSRLMTINKQSTITIGDNCFIGYRFSCLSKEQIYIGDNVLIASDVFISDYNHNIDLNNTFEELISKPVHIGNGVWIGEKTIILSGVTIGDHCVIGAGSVVTKSIPDYCLAIGNPARIIKKWNATTKTWEKA